MTSADLTSIEAYQKALRQDAARLPSGPRTKYWVYRNVVLPDSAGRKQTIPVFFVLWDDRTAQTVLRGKTPVSKGLCGMDSGQLVFVPERGEVPTDLLKKSVPGLLGKPLRIPPDDGDEPPTHPGLDIDKIKKLVIASWSGQRLVKVVSAKRGPLTSVMGYVTIEKFIVGQDCLEMAKRLGLPSSELRDGAYVMRLRRLPSPAGFELRGYTNTPGGKPYVPGGKQDYPPGSGVPQWKLLQAVPADAAKNSDGTAKLFLPGDRYKP